MSKLGIVCRTCDAFRTGYRVMDSSNPNLRAILLSVVLPALISAAVSGAGAWITFQQARNQYNVSFTNAVHDMLPGLRDSKTSGMAFAGLYQLAQDRDQKVSLVLIGISTKSQDVLSILAAMATDPHNKDFAEIEHEPGFMPMLTAASGTGTTPNPAVAAIVKAATSPPPTGWIYYGTTGSNSIGTCPVAVTQVRAGDRVTLCGSHFIRSATSASSDIIGVADNLKNVKVVSSEEIPLSKHSSAVWINVSIPAQGLVSKN